MANQELPRPRRSLRDRHNEEEPSLQRPPELARPAMPKPQKTEVVAPTPQKVESSAQNYLAQVDQVEEEEEKTTVVNNVGNLLNKKPSTQTKTLVNTKKITQNLRSDSSKDIQDSVKKVKGEFQKLEGSVSETKEELAKLSSKISEEATVVKEKAMEFGLQTIESLLNAPKNLINSMVFRKKATPTSTSNNKTTQAPPVKRKVVPKIKYGDLVAQRVEFFTYDKQRLVDRSLPPNIVEEVFMTNAVADVKYCSRFVKELQHPSTGIYAYKPISFIFDNITPEDINYFLYYVSKNTPAFVGQNYKFSEAFATWIIRKSHEL